ncbi:hypothetical protein NEOLEDRAFT_1128597 [Neolentinus lepideus HHB14362 ss-1]|uniref:Uncharacterized protein n=1 Tax=Neolentinus lepideus HHB14362 ss-1 TaxID=1314782 RepID=A0A165V2P9_9AGAM|nr:hypothetical protein NEOLEDRAFT_1128597 [Neolentinus lepideus HHB14362 ss-1]
MGVAGEWQMVAPTTTQGASASPAPEPEPTSISSEATKRLAEGAAPDDDTGRGWKLKKKKLDVGLGELYDPGLIPIKLKTKKEEPAETQLSETKVESDAAPSGSMLGVTSLNAPRATGVPKWSKVQWKKPSEDSPAPESSNVDAAALDLKQESPDEMPVVKAEQSSLPLPPNDSPLTTDVPPTKEEDVSAKLEEPTQAAIPLSTPGGGGLFKKRKAPAGTAGTRSRRGV